MRQLLSFASVAAAAALVFLLPSASSRAAGGGISFETPSVVDPIHTYGEPDIGVDVLGRVFVSGPTGTGTQRSVWNGSIDGGHTFRVITPGAPPTAIQGIEDPPGGGDTDINFDRSGKQYFADLYALACLRVATTADGGATVDQNVLGCDGTPGADRQWLAVYDPAPGTPHDSAYLGPTPLVYLEYNNVVGPGPARPTPSSRSPGSTRPATSTSSGPSTRRAATRLCGRCTSARPRPRAAGAAGRSRCGSATPRPGPATRSTCSPGSRPAAPAART